MHKITSCLYLGGLGKNESGGAEQVISNFNVSPNLEDQTVTKLLHFRFTWNKSKRQMAAVKSQIISDLAGNS